MPGTSAGRAVPVEMRQTFALPGHDDFVVAERLRLGAEFGELVVTYLGPTFWRLFGDAVIAGRPPRRARHWRIGAWATDAEVSTAIGRADAEPSTIADLVGVIELGADGPGGFNGESNVLYAEADGAVWTPHFYTRGRRLGFGALPFGDPVGWEPGDVFLAGPAR